MVKTTWFGINFPFQESSSLKVWYRAPGEGWRESIVIKHWRSGIGFGDNGGDNDFDARVWLHQYSEGEPAEIEPAEFLGFNEEFPIF